MAKPVTDEGMKQIRSWNEGLGWQAKAYQREDCQVGHFGRSGNVPCLASWLPKISEYLHLTAKSVSEIPRLTLRFWWFGTQISSEENFEPAKIRRIAEASADCI